MTIKNLAAAVIKTAKQSGLTVATAESCTAGAVAQALAAAPGASEHFQGGFVTYTKDMKSRTLGVSKSLMEAKSAVCAEVAEAMAKGALERSGADAAVAVTGVAGPDPDEDGNPVGLIFCCTATAAGPPNVIELKLESKDPQHNIAAAVMCALSSLEQACRMRADPS